ncbi:MAG TPA: LLM class flavin-dependent oxidoreductase [Gemmatimonadales bacterium]|jgi:FMNH2-dependent dimethyl sulfone monooxygenase|nr:LLM class flavin-dependent oxidoreductase [Gemmatimonadales bacterium]
MRYGYWLPVFGGWLRNVEDEGMEASWNHVKRLARRSEEIGYDITLIAELLLNDIKGIRAPSLDAWSTAAALAAVTERLELMVAVRPSFHPPAILAKQAANIDRISNGRLALNVVSAWWKDEARRYGAAFDAHDERYARTQEWLDVVTGAWHSEQLDYRGKYYNVEELILEPKPVSRPSRPHPPIYAGGESETAKTLIARQCDAYVMHGDPPERIASKIADMRRRRDQASEALGVELPPLRFGVAAYAIVRQTEEGAQQEVARITNVTPGSPGYGNYQDWIANTKLETRVSVEDYSVSNRGLRAGLIGTPDQVAEQVQRFEEAGVDLLLLQCSPQLEEMERFADSVIAASSTSG